MSFDHTQQAAARSHDDLMEMAKWVMGREEHDESEAIEWKSQLDLASKPGSFSIARAILGMANRDPERAQRQLGGCGYFLVGVSHGELSGIDPLDPADLHQKLKRYLGDSNGPSWDHSYICLDDRIVLVVTVEPPEAGHPLWPLRRECCGIAEGAVFVRNPGRTAPATAAEIDMLSRRATQIDPLIKADVQVELLTAEPLPCIDSSRLAADIEEYVDAIVDPMIVSARRPTESQPRKPENESASTAKSPLIKGGDPAIRGYLQGLEQGAAFLRKLGPQEVPEDRSPAQFVEEVEHFAHQLRQHSQEYWKVQLQDLGLGLVRIRVTNLSEAFLTGIEIEVVFDHSWCEVLLEEPAPSPPRAPLPYGANRVIPGPFAGASSPARVELPDLATIMGPVSGISTQVESKPVRVTIHLEELRPLATNDSEEFVLLLTPEHPGGELSGAWTLTARDLHRVIDGSIEAPIASHYVSYPFGDTGPAHP